MKRKATNAELNDTASDSAGRLGCTEWLRTKDKLMIPFKVPRLAVLTSIKIHM